MTYVRNETHAVLTVGLIQVNISRRIEKLKVKFE